ncbi:hypothetical protein ACH5RR_039878 [Cinchona calisaya]|uniref:Uncharacterized protein n=1 Tax=Cinchona calisaya TaxID=153742 RepID=A0ABD2Y4P1_9GENT
MVDCYVNVDAHMNIADNVHLPLVIETTHVTTKATQMPQAEYQTDELIQERVLDLKHIERNEVSPNEDVQVLDMNSFVPDRVVDNSISPPISVTLSHPAKSCAKSKKPKIKLEEDRKDVQYLMNQERLLSRRYMRLNMHMLRLRLHMDLEQIERIEVGPNEDVQVLEMSILYFVTMIPPCRSEPTLSMHHPPSQDMSIP